MQQPWLCSKSQANAEQKRDKLSMINVTLAVTVKPEGKETHYTCPAT